jgi:CHAT domain-containing protein
MGARAVDGIRGEGVTPRPTELSIDRLQHDLGDDRELIEFIEMNGAISAVVVSQQRCHFHRLTTQDIIRPLLDLVLFSLTRVSRSEASAASLAAASASAKDALEQLDGLLVRPLRLRAKTAVIAPTGILHGVPWGGLPSLFDRSVVVTPSATRWLPTPTLENPSDRLAIATGPGLASAGEEANSVRMHYRSSNFLSGDDATVTATLKLLDKSAIAHIACHGNFRRENPMFSSLGMADGPMTVYDLEQLESPPCTVVLPSCNAASSAISVGDELVGTATALLGIGVRTVVAPLTVINDQATVPIMSSLHHYLSSGLLPGEALMRTRVDAIAQGEPAGVAAAISLLCLA